MGKEAKLTLFVETKEYATGPASLTSISQEADADTYIVTASASIFKM